MNEKARISTKSQETKRENFLSQKQNSDFSQTEHGPFDQTLLLQRNLGNQALQRMMESGAVQAKLKISQPNNKYEREADRVADLVMRMPEPGQSLVNGHWSLVQRESTCPECMKEEEGIQTKPIAEQITPLVQREIDPEVEEDEEDNSIPPFKAHTNQSPALTTGIASGIQSLKSGGQSLPQSIRSFYEPRFGKDFSQVRVHTDSRAGEAAKSLNAKAFTIGKDVVFGTGQYSPGSVTGKRLLAHELTHVLQQKGSISGAIQRQAFRDCTPTRTGQPGMSQTDIDDMIQQSMRMAHHRVGFAVRALEEIKNGRGTADQQRVLQAHFGALTNTQIDTLLSRFRTMLGRLDDPNLIICNSAGSFYCRPPRDWCAYTDCPSPGALTHLCPPFFQTPSPCDEPNQWSIMVHEAARAVGGCGNDVQPGPGYPPANAMNNVFSYSGFTREIAGLMMPQPGLAPPTPPRPDQPSLIEGIIRHQERRMRERIIESVEEL